MNPYISTRLFFLIGSLVFFPGCAGVRHQQPPVHPLYSVASKDISHDALSAMPERELLTYEVRWIGLKVGSVTLSIRGKERYKDRDVYVLEARMQANEFLSAFYHIADRYTSYMDAETLVTLQHEAFRHEGGYRKDALIEFDQENHKAYFTNRIDGSSRVIDVPPGTHDMLTSFYHVLRVPLAVGDSVEYQVCHNERMYLTRYPVTGEATVCLPRMFGAPVETLELEPVAYELNGRKVEKGSVKAYYLKEPRHILVMAVIKGPVFTKLVVSLTGVERQ